MKKLIVALLAAVLLVLDYSALDDITTNRQPNYYFEYLMIFSSAIILSYFAFQALKKKKNR